MENKLAAAFLREFDDSRYPEDFTDRFEAMECLNRNQAGETLLVRERASGKLLVAKCFEVGHPLFDAAEPAELRGLTHPGLPAFAEEFCGVRLRCVLRDYIPGKTLWELKQESTFSEEDIRSAGIQLCRILKYLHSQSPPVIHRDIKPQNIIMREDGSLALIDLGISRLYVAGAQADTVLCGTQDFAPPEQYGFLQTDSRSDIYSLGILLAWMLTGRARPISMPRTALEHAINKCAAFAPDDRFRDAEAAERAFKVSQSGVRKTKRLRYAAVVLFAAALLSAGFIWLGTGTPASTQETYAEQASPSAAIKSAAGFTEPLIEEAVRLMLGKTPDAPMTPTEIASVTELFIDAGSVYTDIGTFYNAHSERFSRGMTGRGPITTLEDLKLLPHLQVLCMAGEQLTDISPLASLEELFQVELRFNDVSDISPLSGLKNLSTVGLNSNPVADVSPLIGCPSLQMLDLCSVTADYDGSVLAQLGDLDFLDISNGTDSYQYLGGKTIRELKLSKTTLSDLSCVQDVKGLQRLELWDTPLSSLSGLEDHPEITYLNLCGIPAADYSVLLKLPKLSEVVASEAARDLIEPVKAQGSFSVTYQ
jgi:serine/threonine protein kinase